MNEKLAKNVIRQAIEVAQKSGVYSIKDSALIYQAMLALGINADENEMPGGETPKDENPETPETKKNDETPKSNGKKK